MTEVDEKLRAWLSERNVDEVEALVPDITGNARGKIIPAYRFLKGEGVRLPEALLVQTVTGEWPDDDLYDELVHPADRDLFLIPDASSARMVPWAEEPTAQIIHDCVDAEGKYHELSSRNVLRSVLQLYADEGLEPIVAPEVEFYLVEKNVNSDNRLRPPIGRSGRPERARQSYSIDALNEFDSLFEEMYDFCEVMDLDVDTLIHESGAAQMEVNFEHADALSRADQVFLFKRMMREVAMRHDVFATFLAKPMENEPGSSMHIHQSLNDVKTGKNVFSSPDDRELTETFRHYIGGLQKYTAAATILYAPYVNSYRRIAYGDSAPRNVAWGIDNRTAGLRVPVSSAANRRVESRFAGSDVNPYLAIAATLACGYLGMKEKIEPTPRTEGSALDLEQTLPVAFEVSLALLEEETALQEILGRNFVKAYVGIKRKEFETFFRVISSWEREYLLLNV
ncbi:MAG: glutamine synthetase [Gammaproteobacteria bacterium]|nr:glutamine synthetase [Gammaproteobacteria bacterium]